jgi:hypothetical protein
MEPVAIFFSMRQTSFPFMRKQRGPEKYAEEMVDEWEAMYHEGKSYRQIAAFADVPYPTVFWHLHTKRGLGDGRRSGRKKQYVGLSDGEVTRQWQLKKNYDLSLEQRDVMERAQGGVCAICGQPPKGGKTSNARLNVDHDHATKKVRALLCSDCNHGIGKLKDDPSLMYKAADYIRRHREVA